MAIIRLDSSLVRHCSLSSTATPISRKKKRSAGGKKKTGLKAGLKERVEPKWTHYSKQDLRTKFEPKSGIIEGSTIGLLPLSSVPPFTLAATPSPPHQATTTTTYQLPTTIYCEAPPPPQAQQAPNLTDYCTNSSAVDASSAPTVFSPPAPNPGTTVYQCTSPPTTYLCPAPTILVSTCPTTNNPSNNIEPMVEPSFSPPSYIYATTTSPNLIYTEGETNSSCSLYSPVPSSPRDVNEISLHISLLDTRTQLVTF